MTNEQLTAYLQDDSYLYAVGYEELKTLVMQYPYATNLRILLLKKSFLEQNKDFDRNLQMAATFSTNRKYLYHVVQKVKSFKAAPQSVILGEDYLELTELSNIEKLLAEKQVSDALGVESKFDTLAADWQLEFGNLETAEEANAAPKIKGVDAEEIEMFELAFNAQIAENQTIDSEEDLSHLIDNLVLEFNENHENQKNEDPSVNADMQAELLDLFTPSDADFNAENVEEKLELKPEFNTPIPEKIAEKQISFFDLIQPKHVELPQEIIEEKPLEIDEINPEIFVENNAKINAEKDVENKVEITEEEMDEYLSTAFKSIKRHEPDEFLATTFAVFNGTHSDDLNDEPTYSIVEEQEFKDVINAPINAELNTEKEHEEMGKIDAISRLEEIEAMLDKELKDKALASEKPVLETENWSEKSEPIIEVKTAEISEEIMGNKEEIKPATSLRKVIVKDLSELETARKAATKLEKEITLESPSHSFRVIKKQLSQEVVSNSFTVVIKDKKVDNNAPINSELNSELNPIKSELIAELNQNKTELNLELNSAINSELIAELNPIKTELIDELNTPINTELSTELIETSPTIAQTPTHEATPQYVMNLDDIEPVSEHKSDKMSDDLEKILSLMQAETPPQYFADLDNKAPILDDKTDELTEMTTAKNQHFELEILNENKVTIATKTPSELPPTDLSFTDWLRQYRMKQAEADAQAAAVKVEAKLPHDDSEVIDNQYVTEIDDNRKAIKQNLDALFEEDNSVPDNFFGLAETPQNKVEKAQNTEGVADIIRLHLNAEISDETPEPTEIKKKKKKKEMHELAARSIEEDKDMVSETLADLLVWQGKNAKAIEMYHKLSLAFPDKRTYFASKIETIKTAVT